MILSNISVPLLGIVDTAILGHLPSAEYLSGVAIGASVMSMLLWAFGFLRMGTTGLVARSTDLGIQWLVRALVLAMGLGIILFIVASPLIYYIVEWMNASQEAQPHALAYLQIRLLSAPLALANFAILGFFIGRQDSRAPLYILFAANLLNIALDFLFILGLGLGAKGAAAATVLADIFAFLLGLYLLSRVHVGIWSYIRKEIGQKKLLPWIDSSPWINLLKINTDLFIRTCLLLLTLTFLLHKGQPKVIMYLLQMLFLYSY
ncbi:MATE family efflux transporter [Microbulbifer sp. MKSA007]|nr:MATE family efflux transporter [Microbulbifer sp. MKSA007]